MLCRVDFRCIVVAFCSRGLEISPEHPVVALMMYSYLDGHDGARHGQDKLCLNFTHKEAVTVFEVKMTLGMFTILANLLAIILIIASKKYRDILYRLVVYLLMTDILQAIAICLALFPITVRDANTPAQVKPGDNVTSTAWLDFCAATGFILMVTMWMGNVVIIWIVGHLLVLGWREQRLIHTDLGNGNYTAQKVHTPCSRKEILGVLFLFFGPMLIGWIPFVLPHEMYGISGLWCWIKEYQTHCGDLKLETLLVVFIFFYGPLVLIVIFSLICMIFTIILVCHAAARRPHAGVAGHHQRRMKEIIIALAYPMLYCTVCLILLANRVYSVSNPKKDPNLPLWYAHTIADPVRVMLPAIAFLLHPFVWRDLCNRGLRPDPSTTRNNQERQPPDQINHVNAMNEEGTSLIPSSNADNTYGSTYDDDDRYLSGMVDS